MAEPSEPARPGGGYFLTIIILTLNSQRFIGECLHSICPLVSNLAEIIVVDGGSSDATVAIVREITPFARIVPAPGTNIPQARNIGLRAATGEYVLFLDSDERLLPNGFAALWSRVRETTPDYAVAANYHIDETGGRIGAARLRERGGWLQLLDTGMGMLSTVCRRDLLLRLGGFDERLDLSEDLDMWLRVLENGAGMKDPTFVAEHRVRPDSASHEGYRRTVFFNIKVGLRAAKRRGAPLAVRVGIVGTWSWLLLKSLNLNYVVVPLPVRTLAKVWSRLGLTPFEG